MQPSFKHAEFYIVWHCEAEGQQSTRTAMQRAVSAVHDILQHAATTTVIVSHGNLMTLLLKRFDDRLGFETWQRLTTPDVFRVVISNGGPTIERVWCEVPWK